MGWIAAEQGSPATLLYDINQRLNKFSLPKVDQPHTHTYKGVVEKGSFSFYSKSEKWASNTCGIIHWVYARCCVRKGTNSWTPEHICPATKFYLTLQFSSMIWTSMQLCKGIVGKGVSFWGSIFYGAQKEKENTKQKINRSSSFLGLIKL